jgi:hypothetical protein
MSHENSSIVACGDRASGIVLVVAGVGGKWRRCKSRINHCA